MEEPFRMRGGAREGEGVEATLSIVLFAGRHDTCVYNGSQCGVCMQMRAALALIVVVTKL